MFFVHTPHDSHMDFSVIEFCGGMGGFSLGSSPVGLHTAAFVEVNSLACEALRANLDSPVIQGDLHDIDTIKRTHAMRPEGPIQVTAGFPCQPFSLQGDRQGMDDSRGTVLYAIFRGAWLLQARALLLECVANVINFPVLH